MRGLIELLLVAGALRTSPAGADAAHGNAAERAARATRDGVPTAPAVRVHATQRLVGADLSSLESVERGGAAFHDGAQAGDAIELLSRRGTMLVRLRLWHTPAGDEGSLASVTRLTRRARALGMRVLVDFHYSDTWADPGHQHTPRAWSGLDASTLADSLRLWTRDALVTLRQAGAAPDVVQLGNEIANGLLWPAGRVFGDQPPRWDALAALLRAARRGVDEAGEPSPVVLLHHDQGGNAPAVSAWSDSLRGRGVAFDAVALSFYPWWHGSLDDLEVTVRALADRRLDAWLVEVAYPWSLAPGDATHNVVGAGLRLPPEFAPTIDGQRAFAKELVARMKRHPNVRALVWWEAADVAAPRRGSAWENAALFDATGALLPAAAELATFGGRRR